MCEMMPREIECDLSYVGSIQGTRTASPAHMRKDTHTSLVKHDLSFTLSHRTMRSVCALPRRRVAPDPGNKAIYVWVGVCVSMCRCCHT